MTKAAVEKIAPGLGDAVRFMEGASQGFLVHMPDEVDRAPPAALRVMGAPPRDPAPQRRRGAVPDRRRGSTRGAEQRAIRKQ
jgi:hypothetical protein